MASSKNTPKNQKRERKQWPNEVLGILLCGGGLLLLLSLISFTPDDLRHIPFIGGDDGSEAESEGCTNWIGPVGGFLGYCSLWALGAAAYLLPLAMLWMGVAKLVFDARASWRTWMGCGVFILSGSALMAVQSLFLQAWAETNHLIGVGGGIGYALGTHFLEALLNKPGALLVLICVYLVSLILLTGLHPIQFSRELLTAVVRWWGLRGERRELKQEKAAARQQRQMERDNRLARKQGLMEQDEPKPTAAPKVANKKAAKKAAKKRAKQEGEDSEAAEQAELPLKVTPPPQVIDASVRKKVSADPGSKPFAKKKLDHAGLSTEGYEDYELPGFDLLNVPVNAEPEAEADKGELVAVQTTIIETLKAFGVEVTAGNITRGPTITRYEVYPSMGLRVSRITQLEADLARATKAERINILAPVPGSDTVGIEIANNEKVAVPLHDLLHDPAFTSSKVKIPLALGKDVYGNTVIGDLAAMPHLLVAGATGSGKSVCINTIISSILFKFSPDELRFIMVDPKVVEMQMYNSLPHLAVPVVTDPNKVLAALRWVVNEMERRYRYFADVGVRNFDGFNSRELPVKEVPEEAESPEGEEDEAEEVYDAEHIDSIAQALTDGELGPPSLDGSDDDDDDEEEIPDRVPYIVVIIDELADLMQTAPADMEMCIARIAQKARAAGIHLIIATQTPRADVVTGIIKANIPSRIAFQVSSKLDSRVILDVSGADKLVGKGDMLYLPPGSAKLERAQGAFISDEEVEDLIEYCSNQVEQKFEETVQASIESGDTGGGDDNDISDADEEVIEKCLEVIRQEKKASTSLLQRRLRLGYTRAARMMDILEDRGIIGPGEGARPREILINVGQDEA